MYVAKWRKYEHGESYVFETNRSRVIKVNRIKHEGTFIEIHPGTLSDKIHGTGIISYLNPEALDEFIVALIEAKVKDEESS